jgi:hypothetical protein
MNRLLFLFFAVLTFCSFPVRAQEDWKPAASRLMTRWAKEVNPQAPLPDYPRPQMTRPNWLSLNGLWQFENASNASPLPKNRDLKERVLVPFPIQSALSGIGQRHRQVWYRRTFEVPENWKNQTILLHFGAVNYESGIYLNGKLLGAHKGGYDGFSFDVTEQLKEGANELIVGAINSASWNDQVRGKQSNDPRGSYYTAATGIWQSVWLEPVGSTYLKELIVTPDVDGGGLEIRTEAVNAEGDTVSIEVKDGTTSVAKAQGAAGTLIRVPVPNAKLWSPDNPFLYSLQINLIKNNQVVDSVGSYIGMRKVSIGRDETGKTRLLLNNKAIFQVGVIDQGYWPDGIYTAPTDEALKSDIEAAKKLGFNMIRKHAKVEPARWYYWADKLGMLVWQDMPIGESKTPVARRQFENELRRMVENRRHHPSIIMWVLFDEARGQFDADRLTQLVKVQDPTRLVSNASGGDDKYAGDVHDTHSLPAPRSNAPEADRAAVVGKFGGLNLFVKDHSWQETPVTTENVFYFSEVEGLTRRYETLLNQAWKLKDVPGASAVAYAQLFDVETETNGLYSYDRAVLKMDENRVRAANLGQAVLKPLIMLMPTAQAAAIEWKYTFKRPQEGWERRGFDDLDWKTGPAPFGNEVAPAGKARTEWKTGDIWLRREVELPGDIKNPLLLLLHDDDAEVYINGVLAAKVKDFVNEYEELPLSPESRAALVPGKNLIAIHVKQNWGTQVIDLGLATY